MLEAECVTKQFGDNLAVDCANLQVGPGEVVGLLGANGAGKTTLLRMVLGLLRPTSGEVRLFDWPPSRETRRRIGYVPQSLGLYEDLTVRQNVDFAAAAFGAPRRELFDPDLAAAGNELVRDLPLGLRRRTAFAAALSHSPELLVLDEPTSGVDPLARARLWDTVRSVADEDAGVVVTTHYMDEARQCDRLVVMASGRVVAAGTMGDIVGDATAVDVRAERWQDAFTALDDRGLPISLVGRGVRVPDADPAEVAKTLEESGIAADVHLVPATFEERFVALSRESARTSGEEPG
jgi:ABC-2 type transport system ATP-binding protein